jgi:probable phosphoglycerate mutase
MQRTRQTAEVIARHLGLVPVPVPGLEEARFGEWDGLTFAEVMARWPAQMSAWLESPQVAPPGGESLQQIYDRVGAALAGVLEQHRGARIVVAAHVGSIRSLTARALGAPLQSMNRMELAPASITTLTWYDDGNASMRSFAESSHLEGLVSGWTP